MYMIISNLIVINNHFSNKKINNTTYRVFDMFMFIFNYLCILG